MSRWKKHLHLLAQPKARGRQQAMPQTPLKVFEASPVTGEPIKLLSGRYGPYVTDTATNASLPKGTTPEDLTFEQAVELLAERAARRRHQTLVQENRGKEENHAQEGHQEESGKEEGHQESGGKKEGDKKDGSQENRGQENGDQQTRRLTRQAFEPELRATARAA